LSLDGERHFSITIDEYEAERTKFLEGQGLKVIRFENKDLRENIDGVLQTIRENFKTEK
jgi:very-short-patch-repair endonuclease